jgi:hypothetical protein
MAKGGKGHNLSDGMGASRTHGKAGRAKTRIPGGSKKGLKGRRGK